MSHLSDKDLDHLAREAAEQLDVDQNSSGWEALQSKLDVEMPVEKRRRRWFFFLVFPLLGAILYYAYVANSDHNEIAELNTEQVIKPSGQAQGPTEMASPNPEKTLHSNQPNQNERSSSMSPESKTGAITDQQPGNETRDNHIAPVDGINNKPATDKNPNASIPATAASQVSRKVVNRTAQGDNIKISRSSNGHGTTGITSSYKRKGLPAVKSRSTKNTIDNNAKDAVTSDRQVDGTASTTKPDAGKEAQASPPASIPGSASGEATAQAPDSSRSSAIPTVPDSVMTAKSSSPKKRNSGSRSEMPYKGLTLGLVAGPDVSEVNRKGTDKTGINIGLHAAYRFNGRLSLVSGLSYTHKFYTAYGEDYKPKKGTWLDTVSLSKVVGDCYMFELPLNLRFDVMASRKNYAFVSAGLSSYFMRKENYDFHYTNNTGQYDSRYRSYKVSEDYLFKVLNLSVGYERMLTKRLSLQLEPYIKLPLNGLGFGNMQLSSYGAFFGVKYHAGKLKAR